MHRTFAFSLFQIEELMCFSATASIASSALLATVGTGAALTSRDPRLKAFVMIPFLFSIQQLTEAMVWISLHQQGFEASISSLAVKLFVFFAFAIWPFWIPWSIHSLEENPKRKNILKFCLSCGVIVFTYASAALILKAPEARVLNHSLDYRFPDPIGWIPSTIQPLLYFSSTVLPLLVTSHQLARKMGWLILGSLVLAKVIKAETLTSTWCFFSALVSLVIAVILVLENRKAGLLRSQPMPQRS